MTSSSFFLSLPAEAPAAPAAAPAKKTGDMMIAELQEGTVLVYYEQANEDSGWKNQVRADLYQAKINAFTQECAQYEVNVLEQNYKYIRV